MTSHPNKLEPLSLIDPATIDTETACHVRDQPLPSPIGLVIVTATVGASAYAQYWYPLLGGGRPEGPACRRAGDTPTPCGPLTPCIRPAGPCFSPPGLLPGPPAAPRPIVPPAAAPGRPPQLPPSMVWRAAMALASSGGKSRSPTPSRPRACATMDGEWRVKGVGYWYSTQAFTQKTCNTTLHDIYTGIGQSDENDDTLP